MKHILAIILFFVSTWFAAAKTDRALLVAIDKYPKGSGWAEIHGTNDIAPVKHLLATKGFREGNIVTLINDRATKAAIVEELDKLARASRSGDNIYIHFSCHGQQMADDNGDEPDGLDEALIPYDARRRFERGVYEGENHLRDDELAEKLENIRRKSGKSGNVVLVLDACHSGTADRDSDEELYVRGTPYIFGPLGFAATEGNRDGAVYDIKTGEGLAALTVVAACLPDQINYEYRTCGTYYGSLTYAFCELMLRYDDISMYDLRKELSRRVAECNAGRKHIQTPMIETTDEDKKFAISR